MEYYICRNPDSELYHWGVKGMKWGIRRYQNKDGSLTKAGKKRRAKLEGELEKLGGGQKKTDGDDAPKKKSISEMSNKELQEHTTRMQLEKNYYDAQKQLAIANPPKVSAGQKFANKMLNDVIMPAATNAGKQYLEKMLKEKAGIKEDVKINWDDMIKKQTYEKNERDKVYQDLKRNNDINQEKDRAEARDRKRAEESGKSPGNSDNVSGNKNKQKQSANSQKTEKSKVYEGTVEGSGTSKKSSSESKWSSKKETVIDAEWSEVGVDDVPTSMTNRGKSYVTALLEAPKERDD
jgi:hypothetical protein